MAVVLAFGAFAARRVSASTAVVVQVEPATSLVSRPVQIQVTGLPSDHLATLAVSTVDGKGGQWTSSATYRTTSTGVINLDQSSTVSGSYKGLDPMGLIESMTPTKATTNTPTVLWAPSLVFHIAVKVDGHQVAGTTFYREGDTPGVRVQTETLAGTGFVGQWWLPPPGTPRHPGVLVFGGSEGGISGTRTSAALASAGYPTLDIAYFRSPAPAQASLEAGLPSQLRNIPLEYFAKALRWLAEQPQVEPQKLYVESGSRGSEAAFLLGVHYPTLVHGIINLSPSDVVRAAYPGGKGSAWTFQGKPLRYLGEFIRATHGDGGHFATQAEATIPVQDIHGPTLLACGVDDQLDPESCAYSRDAEHRLTKAHDPFAQPLYTYSNAGHLVDDLIPYGAANPAALSSPEYIRADNPSWLANDQADAKLWPHVLNFLATT
jgi:Acyl-CoA thioester hydrolase/BAAT N-terminal region/BAAT / Acyl-CoA thioester hydrolase C terminal